MKCKLCNQRKAKRFCPAKGDQICPQCCGEKRVLEIDCPESCQFLQLGREHEARLHARYYSSADQVNHQKHQRILQQFDRAVSQLEHVLAEERRSSRDFNDKEAAAALDLVLENLRTEEKGILYERTSNDIRIDIARRRLTEVVQSLRNPRGSERTANLVVRNASEGMLKLKDAIECLETLRNVVQNHLDEGPTAPSYVEFLARLLPSRTRIENTSQLIIPGR